MNQFTRQLKTGKDTIRMTSAERSRVHTALSEHMGPVPSPYASFFSFPRVAMVAMVAVFVVGGTASAAESALPGDILYPVKIHAVEPVEGALAVSHDAKTAWHAKVAARRISEAGALAAKGTLTASRSAELAADFEQHTTALSEATAELARADDTQVAVPATEEATQAEQAEPQAGQALFMAVTTNTSLVASDTAIRTPSRAAAGKRSGVSSSSAIEHSFMRAHAELSAGSTSEAQADFNDALNAIDALRAQDPSSADSSGF